MDEPLVSIVIPVYNAQSFLERCLVSCRQQSYRNIEIIMVNDGSTDHSPELCRKYARMDRRFVFVSQKNAGVSSARNTGIRNARGVYITFADSDDWLYKNAVREYVNRIGEDGTDLAVAGFTRIINSVGIPMADIREDLMMTREYFAGCMADSPADFYYGVVWNKLYRTDIIKSHYICFSRRLKWCEDFLFNLDYLRYAKSVSTIRTPLYYYVKRSGSICESQLSCTKTLAMKYELLRYYRDLYKAMNLYDENKLKINGFLFAYAHDGGESEYRRLRIGQVTGRLLPYKKVRLPVLSLLKKKTAEKKRATLLHAEIPFR